MGNITRSTSLSSIHTEPRTAPRELPRTRSLPELEKALTPDEIRQQKIEAWGEKMKTKFDQARHDKQAKLKRLVGTHFSARVKRCIARAKAYQLHHNAKHLPLPSALNQNLSKAKQITAPALETSKEGNTLAGVLQAPVKAELITDGSETAAALGQGAQISALGFMGGLGALATTAGIWDLCVSWNEQGILGKRVKDLKSLVQGLKTSDQVVDEKLFKRLDLNREAIAEILERDIDAPIHFNELAEIFPTDMLESSIHIIERMKVDKRATLTGGTDNKHITTALIGGKTTADIIAFSALVAEVGSTAIAAGVAGGGVLAAIGAYGVVSDGVAAPKAQAKAQKAEDFLQSLQGVESQHASQTQALSELKDTAQKVKDINQKSVSKKIISMIKNTFFTATGIMAFAGGLALGAAFLSNPIGWATLAVGAVGFGIAIGLAAQGYHEGRNQEQQDALNTQNRTQLEGLKRDYGQMAKSQRLLKKQIEHLEFELKLTDPRHLEQTRHLEQIKEQEGEIPRHLKVIKQRQESLVELRTELQATEGPLHEIKTAITGLTKELLAKDKSFRAQKVLEHLKQPSYTQAYQYAHQFAQDVLGLSEGDIKDLRKASTPLAESFLASKV